MFKPLNQFIIVRCKIKGEHKTESGLFLSGNVGSSFIEATVLATSDAVSIEGTNLTRPPRVSEGQRVMLFQAAPPAMPGVACEMGNQEVRLIQEEELVGVLPND